MKIYCSQKRSNADLSKFVGKDLWILCWIRGAGKWYIRILSWDEGSGKCEINRIAHSLINGHPYIPTNVDRIDIEYIPNLILKLPLECYTTEELFEGMTKNPTSSDIGDLIDPTYHDEDPAEWLFEY